MPVSRPGTVASRRQYDETGLPGERRFPCDPSLCPSFTSTGGDSCPNDLQSATRRTELPSFHRDPRADVNGASDNVLSRIAYPRTQPSQPSPNSARVGGRPATMSDGPAPVTGKGRARLAIPRPSCLTRIRCIAVSTNASVVPTRPCSRPYRSVLLVALR